MLRGIVFALLFLVQWSGAVSAIGAPLTECRQCHSEVLSGRNVHAAASADCLICHQPDHPTGERPYLNQSVNEQCGSCHLVAALLSDCADPAGGANCGHPATGHPVRGGSDPVYPERQFNCVSCHNPHSSNEPRLFRYAVSKQDSPYRGTTCLVCHWKKFRRPPAPPAPPRAEY